MTLSLKSVPTIEDLPPKRVRGLLRRASTEFNLHWLSHALRSDLNRARIVVIAMERAGLVERDHAREAALRSSDPCYRVTGTGRSLARSSGAKRIERLTAEEALAGFMERVSQSNANPNYLYSVNRVVVFGSYLEDANRLGDVDVAVDLQPRIPLKGNWVTQPMKTWVKSWRKLMSACNMPDFRFHDLRHTFRTQGAEAGVPLEVMMAQLGHMDRQTSLEYVHIQQHALQRAQELIEREQAEVLRAARDRHIEAHPAPKMIEETGWSTIRNSSKVAGISNAEHRKTANSHHRPRCRYSSSAQLM